MEGGGLYLGASDQGSRPISQLLWMHNWSLQGGRTLLTKETLRLIPKKRKKEDSSSRKPLHEQCWVSIGGLRNCNDRKCRGRRKIRVGQQGLRPPLIVYIFSEPWQPRFCESLQLLQQVVLYILQSSFLRQGKKIFSPREHTWFRFYICTR